MLLKLIKLMFGNCSNQIKLNNTQTGSKLVLMETDFNLKRHKFYWCLFLLVDPRVVLTRTHRHCSLVNGWRGGWLKQFNLLLSCLYAFLFCCGCQACDGCAEAGNAQRFSADSVTFITCSKACAGQSIICKRTNETIQDFLRSALSCPSSWSLEVSSFYLQILQLKMLSGELHDCRSIILLAGFKFFVKNNF